eukprot:Seg1197.6 transcript_id=Seg1197.6/GoldUCD/mRNA.D3Y31 product="HAUS augmin-like complex subunit 7" protein_id=Seg1197.6/GoldUCD/D3Y31
MAGKMDAKNFKLENIKRKLVEVDCPFVEDDDESWMISMFEPCEARIRLITWLVTKFDAKFGEILLKQVPTADNRIESRVQRMLFVTNMMGLCQADDLDIIKGTASKKKQIKFWENLLDLVLICEKFSHPTKQNRSSQGTGSLGYESDNVSQRLVQSSHDYFENNYKFIDNLTRKERTEELFAPSITLFPPDLEKSFMADDDRKTRSTAPDLPVLNDLVEKLAADAKKTQREYDLMMAQFQHSDLDQSEVDNNCKKLSLAITMLNQLITNFLHCYESELRHWCNRPKTKKSGVGPACKTTLQMMTKHDELLKQMQTLESAYNTITNDISNEVSCRSSESETGHDALMNLREVIDILKESELRINDSL